MFDEDGFTTATDSQGNSNCVKVKIDHNARRVFVRDSKLGADSPTLEYTYDEWRAFRAGMLKGEFDLPE